MLLTRRKLAGVVLALALAGALSAGVASGVERVRGKARKRPEPSPPFSQREKTRAQLDARDEAPPSVVQRDAVESPVAGEPVAPDVRASVPSQRGRAGRPAEARSRPHPVAWAGGGTPEPEPPREAATPTEDNQGHTHGTWGAGLTARIPAPMRVGWTVVEASTGSVRLVAEVERRLGFGAPVAVRLSLPRGAALLEGPEDFTVPEGPGGDVRAVTYVVTFKTGTVPTEDLVLVAHAEGASFGAHAEERYSFGRVTPFDEPRPIPEGPALPASVLMGEAPEAQDGHDEPSP
ncbi:hypothetical protein [Pyxidicoccus xibeiensis]|uniref:hypothetical protein n=1 Tax=Pyxidicoccus xibeiensis TaxID=2906759 RepID=UPI0020A8117B|nr:hypothetical protein [Pyxidicoccus xibeiensis]MCP3139008.1 hypothetical protein [Pyxidicoccus xibeiensis]